MFPQDLGTNRLRSGFRGRTIQRSASHDGTPSDSDDEDSLSPIQIHDLDAEDDETDGGMTLNVQGQGDHDSPIVISDDEAMDQESPSQSELEEGEEREDNEQTRDSDADVSFVIDPTPSKIQLCLRDLTPAQQQEQIRYAFWHLPRDEIDLSRPARCLHCHGEGHIDRTCPEKICDHCGEYAQHTSVLCPSVKRCHRCRQPGHTDCQGMKNNTIPCDICKLSGHNEDDCSIKHYSIMTPEKAGKRSLWISCAACASKSHLVGDCQSVPASSAARWSLRLLDPEKVVNLSIQTGADKFERDVENRTMRPAGMKIKGRASLHTANAERRDLIDSDDELENFFSHPPPRASGRHDLPNRPSRSDQYRPGPEPPRHERYDRYNPPADSYRPPRNAFYSTDSFGRPRSRSPPRYEQSTYGRSRGHSPASYSSYRPSDDDADGDYVSHDWRQNRFQEDRRPHQQPLPARGVSIQLPTRKGSNQSLQNAANLPPRPGNSQGQAGNSGSSKKGARSFPAGGRFSKANKQRNRGKK